MDSDAQAQLLVGAVSDREDASRSLQRQGHSGGEIKNRAVVFRPSSRKRDLVSGILHPVAVVNSDRTHLAISSACLLPFLIGNPETTM